MLRRRSKEEIKEIMDVSYEVMLETLGVPENDRYQIVTQHDENEMIILDTGLGFSRSHKCSCVQYNLTPANGWAERIFL